MTELSKDLPQAVDPVRPAPRRRGWLATLREHAPVAGLIAVIIGAWEGVSRGNVLPDYVLPAPDKVVTTLGDDWTVLRQAAQVTGLEIVLGFALALGAALLIAIALHAWATLRRAVYPLLIASQTVPIVVLAPILAIALGYGISPKLAVIALVCFFPVVVTSVDGFRTVDPELLRLMRSLDASRIAVFRRVEFPAALPSIFSGVRVSATYAAIGAVFAEWSGSTDGLGYVMLQATAQLQTDVVFAAIVILTAMSVVLFGIVYAVERVAAPWAVVPRHREVPR